MLSTVPGKHWLNGSIYYWGGNYLQLSHGNKQLICAVPAGWTSQASERETDLGWLGGRVFSPSEPLKPGRGCV